MRRIAWLPLALVAAAPAWGQGRQVAVLRPSAARGPIDELRLAEALRIYTRDLGLEWSATAGPRDEVRLTLSYEATLDGAEAAVTLYALAPGGDPRAPDVLRARGPVDDNLYRALALKVRAQLTEAPPARPPAPVAPPPVAVAPPPAPPSTPRALGGLELGYQLLIADPIAATRQGGFVTLAVKIGGRGEIGAGAGIDTAVAGDHASAMVTPLWLLGRLLTRRGRFEVGGGARIGLVVIAAEGTAPDGAHGSVVRSAALLGGEGLARWYLSPHLAVGAALTVDALVPKQVFTLEGKPAVDTGDLAVGLALVAAVTVP
jgi:hypothetical protein